MSGSERIVVAMSGGVDSSVAAALLMEQGHEVVGLFISNGVRPGPAAARHRQGCCSLDDSMDARAVAAALDVPFYTLNFAGEFSRVMDYFADEYDRGRTPNPCIVCNRDLKFGRLLDHARSIGADRVATGHYARTTRDGEGLAIARARDRAKDQSYVLFPLDQEQLARTVFPLGEMTKAEVRAAARRFGLRIAGKAESQEICFVPDNDYRSFLRARRGEAFEPGPIVGTDGRELGRHEGHQLYTIGQRRGLGGGFAQPVYVVAIRAETNTVVVGDEADLRVAGLIVAEAVWHQRQSPSPGFRATGTVKLRHQQEPAPAEALALADGRVLIRFAEALRAVTPGQAAVFYEGDRVRVGGWIERALVDEAALAEFEVDAR